MVSPGVVLFANGSASVNDVRRDHRKFIFVSVAVAFKNAGIVLSESCY